MKHSFLHLHRIQFGLILLLAVFFTPYADATLVDLDLAGHCSSQGGLTAVSDNLPCHFTERLFSSPFSIQFSYDNDPPLVTQIDQTYFSYYCVAPFTFNIGSNTYHVAPVEGTWIPWSVRCSWEAGVVGGQPLYSAYFGGRDANAPSGSNWLGNVTISGPAIDGLYPVSFSFGIRLRPEEPVASNLPAPSLVQYGLWDATVRFGDKIDYLSQGGDYLMEWNAHYCRQYPAPLPSSLILLGSGLAFFSRTRKSHRP